MNDSAATDVADHLVSKLFGILPQDVYDLTNEGLPAFGFW